MDIIRHCAARPNIRARALLHSRGLTERQVNLFLVLACARLTRTYILCRQEQGRYFPREPGVDTLLHRMHIPTLAARVNLDTAFTARVVRELAPDAITQLHHALRSDHSLLNLVDSHNVA